MKNNIERIRNLLYKKIEFKAKDKEEILKISRKLDILILKYHKSKK